MHQLSNCCNLRNNASIRGVYRDHGGGGGKLEFPERNISVREKGIMVKIIFVNMFFLPPF